MSATTLQEQIDRKKVSLGLANDQIDSLLTGGVQGYTLDTSQSRQTTTRLNLTELRKLVESLENQICILQSRLSSVPLIGRGAW